MKREIWMNGRYLETVRDEEAAKLRVKAYEKQDRHEKETEGYTNTLPKYEIK